MNEKINAAIIGASGYGAGEILRLLAAHPGVQVTTLVSSSSEGASVQSLHPQLHGNFAGLKCVRELDASAFAAAKKPSVVFCALPHGASGTFALSLLRNPELAQTRIIDLSGDLRLHQEKLAQQWYPETEFKTEERELVVYGLPETERERICKARIVSNPGCLSSAAILALAPLASKGLLSGEIVIDAKTGTSGAGRTPQSAFHHPSMNSNCNAYKVLEHRHEPEIREQLGDPFESRFSTLFVPHVIPTSRGIYVTCYLTVPDTQSIEALNEIYRSFYKTSPFVSVIDGVPELRSVLGGNFCQIGLKKRGSKLVVIAALDNLVKGMAGSAVQNMNLMFGFEENCGLTSPGLGII